VSILSPGVQHWPPFLPVGPSVVFSGRPTFPHGDSLTALRPCSRTGNTWDPLSFCIFFFQRIAPLLAPPSFPSPPSFAHPPSFFPNLPVVTNPSPPSRTLRGGLPFSSPFFFGSFCGSGVFLNVRFTAFHSLPLVPF